MTKPIERPPTAGIIPPKVHRGELPPHRPAWQWRKEYKWPFERHREIAMAIPPVWEDGKPQGGWVLCAIEKTKGMGPKERRRKMMANRDKLRRFLERKHPLEDWEIRYITLAGTGCDLELYFRFLGVLTPEERDERIKKRSEAYARKMARHAELEAERALKSRANGKPQK